jgi:diaminopimelate decarboxylase
VVGFSQPSQELVCDGVPLSAIADAEGTPVYVYSAALLRQRYADLAAGFGDYPHRVHYALKANSTLAIARLLRELGAAADANSIWEIELARQAGFAPEDIVFTGVGKSGAELACAVPLGLKAINVESAGELDRVEALARNAGVVARVAIRVNPDIDARSHPHISTGLKINKFGMPVDEAEGLFAGLAGRPALKLVAVHIHVGSQITSIDPVRQAASRLAALARKAQAAGIGLEYVDAGGGLGISYDGGPVPSADQYASALVDEIRTTRLPIVVEPGRSIVGPAAVLVARVVDVKGRTASSDFAIIDAGMTELMRPALYGGFHQIEPVRPRTGTLRQYEIAGPICESTDIVGRDRTLTPLEVGDLVAIRDTGAYGSAMASNYNRRPLPAEVLVDNGEWRVIRKRQTISDMLAQET